MKQYSAEFFGTFWLVLGGCGSAVLSAAFPDVGIGLLGVSFAFGLTVLTMAYAIGHVSGCHLNPAVSIGLWAGGRFPADKLLGYIIAQCLGAIVAGGVLYLIASGKADFTTIGGFASNGYGEHSPGGYSLLAGTGDRSCHDHDVSVHHLVGYPQKCAKWLCRACHWSVPDLDPFNLYPCHQYLSQSCQKPWRCTLCWRLGISSALAVLGCPNCGRFAWRGYLSLYRQ